jgi:hypothetical protein
MKDKNTEHRTPNIERRMKAPPLRAGKANSECFWLRPLRALPEIIPLTNSEPQFDVRCSVFGVRCLMSSFFISRDLLGMHSPEE